MKKHPQKDDRRDQQKIKKRAFSRPKLVPKWAPEASGNVCRRRSAIEGGKNVFLRPPGRQKIGKQFFRRPKIDFVGLGARPTRLFLAPGAPGAASRARSRKEKEHHKTFAEDHTRLGPEGRRISRNPVGLTPSTTLLCPPRRESLSDDRTIYGITLLTEGTWHTHTTTHTHTHTRAILRIVCA